MSTRRIAVLGPAYPYRGGIAHYTARLSRELIAQGHDVLVMNLRRQYPAALFPGTTQEDSSETTFDVPCERIVDSMDPRTWVRAVRRLRRFRPDLLVVQWWHPYFALSFGAVAAGARALGIEVCFVVHNALPHESSVVDRVLTRGAFRAASRLVAHATAEARRIATLSSAPIAVNPHPVYDLFDAAEAPSREDARRALGLAPDARVLLFFGLIRPYKGLDVLLDAMPSIVEETGATLLVAGECYEGIEKYEEQIARLGVGSHVRLDARYIANEEVPALVAASDAMVLPYRAATQSGVAQVAYALGRAVITTAVGGIPEVVSDGETGFVVPPASPAALADAVRRLYEDGVRDRLEAGVVERVASLGWGRMADVVTGRA